MFDQDSESNGDVVCQAGVGWMEINETLEEKGIFESPFIADASDLILGIPLFFPV